MDQADDPGSDPTVGAGTVDWRPVSSIVAPICRIG